MLTCKFENGKEAEGGLRHVTVDTIVLKDNKILMVKRTGKILEGGKWGLLGGFVGRDEDLKEAVAREVMEESGYGVTNITLLTIRDNPDRPHEDRQNISFVFFANATEKTGESDWEVDEQKWFEFDEIPDKEQIAFDHYEDIQFYLECLKGEGWDSILNY